MLLSLGVIMMISIIPIIRPIIIEAQETMAEENSTSYQIEQDLENLNENIQKINDHREEYNITYQFIYQGNISVIYEENEGGQDILYFRYFKNFQVIQYHVFQMEDSFMVHVKGIFTQSYTIGYQNNSKFLFFY